MKIENPNSVIKIRFDGFLSCLIINKPRLLDWPNCRGSVERYFACLPFNKYDDEAQKRLENTVSGVKSIQDLKESGFLDLLEAGEYEFELCENQPTSILYNTILFNSNEIIFNWHKDYIGRERAMIENFQNSFYPVGRQLMFTQPFESLDINRIKYYEEQIMNGERPLAISIRVKTGDQEDETPYQDTDYSTIKYVLDGHHKLVAYQNLKINPSYIVINRVARNAPDRLDDSYLPNLEDHLFYHQIEHIITHGLGLMKIGPELATYIDKYLINAPRFEDTLLQKIYHYAINQGSEGDGYKKKWFNDRLNTIIDKIEKSGVRFDYYCHKDFRKKYTTINKWAEIEKLVNWM